MGHIQHHAFIVTTYTEERAGAAYSKAKALGMSASGVIESAVNGYYSFFVGPDGSNVGWKEDDDGDIQREQFKTWMETLRFEDGSHPLSWVEVAYSSDDRKAEVVADVWENHQGDEA